MIWANVVGSAAETVNGWVLLWVVEFVIVTVGMQVTVIAIEIEIGNLLPMARVAEVSRETLV